jgi:hypothetical protein
VDTRRLWLNLGADLARALTALDQVNDADLNPADRERIQKARADLKAALEEYRKAIPPEEPFLQED